MLDADTSSARVRDTGRRRRIAPYLILFLTVSHSLCGFGKSGGSHGSVSPAAGQKRASPARRGAVPARGCSSWGQPGKHRAAVPRHFLPSLWASAPYRKV